MGTTRTMTEGFTPLFTITNRIAAGLTVIERARGFLEAAKLSEDWVRDMRNRAFVLEAHHTTHIEGTKLTLAQSEKLLAGETVEGADPEDVTELLNYRKAFEFVSDYVAGGGAVTEAAIREIHKRLVQGVRGGAAAPGEYRKVQNYVVNSATGEVTYTPPPAYEVPIQMRLLAEWMNAESELHPVLRSGIAQFQFVHIHPFLDGNGRASRLLSTLLLYRAGYDFKRLFTISEFYDRDRPAFYAAIQTVRRYNMDMTQWLEYFVHGLETQLEETKQRGTIVIRRDALALKHGLSKRQANAIGHLLEHGSLSIQAYASLCAGTPRRTLQRDLKGLVDAGLVVAEGATNKLTYRLTSA
jgi:Fic family protein